MDLWFADVLMTSCYLKQCDCLGMERSTISGLAVVLVASPSPSCNERSNEVMKLERGFGCNELRSVFM